MRLSALRPAGSSGISLEGQSYAEFLGRHGAFLGQTNRSCTTLSRRPPWRCIGATMVTSTFAEFDAAAYGELAKPPPVVRLVLRALLRIHNAVTSGLALGLPPKIRVSGAFSRGLINPAYACARRVRAARSAR